MMEHLSTLFYRLLMHSSICILEEFNLFIFIFGALAVVASGYLVTLLPRLPLPDSCYSSIEPHRRAILGVGGGGGGVGGDGKRYGGQ